MALSPFSQVFGKTLVKEKRLFFYLFYALMNSHKKLYTTNVNKRFLFFANRVWYFRVNSDIPSQST